MNINTLQNVVESAKQKAASRPEWVRAIEKAAAMLQSGELCVTLFADNTALVTSPNGSYRVNGTCPCQARTAHCYHRAAKRLVEMMDAVPGMHGTGIMGVAQCETAPAADVVATKAATSRASLIADIKRANIDGELLRRFRTNDFQLFATETLADICAAIA